MKKKLFALACSLLLLGTPFAEANSASPQSKAANDWLSALADSRSLEGDVVVSGKVLQKGRQKPAAGAIVHLQAWPSAEMLAALEEGESFELTPLAKTVTRPDGSFKLIVDPKVNMDRLRSANGNIDVDVVAMTKTGIVTNSFSIVQVEEARENAFSVAQVDRKTGKVKKPMYVDLEINNPSRTKLAGTEFEDRKEDSAQSEAEAGEYAAVFNEVQATSIPAECNRNWPGSVKYIKDLGPQTVTVGTIHTATSGKNMKFTYTTSAESSLGVGFSWSGSYGTYSSGGELSKSRSQSVGWGEYKAATSLYLNTQYSYAKYCITQPMDGTLIHFYEARPVQHLLSATTQTATLPSSTSYCRPWSSNTSGEKSTTTATKWTNGVSIKPVIGIDLSARTGYATNAKVNWTFVSAGRLCGVNGYPENSPGRLVMRAP